MATASSSKRMRAAESPDLKEAVEQLSQREQKLVVLQRDHEVARQNSEKLMATSILFAESAARLADTDKYYSLLAQVEKFYKLAEDREKYLATLKEDIQRTSSEIAELKCRIEGLTTMTYFDRIVEAGPPSSVEKKGLYKVQMQGDKNLFHCCFPATAQPSLPLTLAHPVFGQFLDGFNNVEEPLDSAICKFVEHLCYEVLGGTKYECEADMNQAFNKVMSKFLGCRAASEDFSCTMSGVRREARTDSTVVFEEWWTMLGELKWERGNTLAQGLQTFGLYVGAMLQAEKRSEMGLLPCFFVEVVGPAIRIGALVHLDEVVAWQPLTPFLNCFYTEYDRTDMATLCRAMRALKEGMAALASYYEHPPTTSMKDVPYSLWKRHCSRIGKKLVFVVTLDDGHKRIFKYCRQYGKEVHKSWADAGLAPALYHCQPIAGGWLEVQMEYLEGWSSAFSLLESLDGDATALLQAAISVALDQALAIKIGNCWVAHGDMRPPNIMIKRREEGGFDVKFIDFDWAGKVDTTRYPPFMNQELPWAAGVGTGALLNQKHDKWWLESAFDRSGVS